LSDVLGLQKACPLPSSHRQTYGAGEARFFAGLLGKQYFTSSDTAAAQSLLTAIRETSRTLVSMDADRRVHIELTETGNKLVLHYVNFMGMTGTFSVMPTQALTTLSIPLGKEVETVELTSPDNATAALAPLEFAKGEQTVSFTVPIRQYSLVVVSLK
jgi:hypothetical protein